MINKHLVKATKNSDKINKIEFKIFTAAKCSVEIEDEGTIILTIGKQNYVIVADRPPKEQLIKVNDSSYDAIVLNRKNNRLQTLDTEHQIVLDGNTQFEIDNAVMDVHNDTITHNGKQYKEGDEIEINGRIARIAIT